MCVCLCISLSLAYPKARCVLCNHHILAMSGFGIEVFWLLLCPKLFPPAASMLSFPFTTDALFQFYLKRQFWMWSGLFYTTSASQRRCCRGICHWLCRRRAPCFYGTVLQMKMICHAVITLDLHNTVCVAILAFPLEKKNESVNVFCIPQLPVFMHEA